MRQYGVTTQKQSPTPLMYVSLYSPDNSRDSLYLRNYLTLHVKDELSRLTGVGDVGLSGSGDYAMRLWLDPNRLASRGLTASDVIAAVREQNVQVSAGQLGAEPSPKNDFLLSINVRGRLRTVQEFGDIVLRTGDDGQVVKLSDVARVELGAGTLRSYFNDKPSAVVGIFLSPGANALEVAKAVYAKFDELSKRFPPGVAYRPVWDPTVFVRESIRAVQHTLIEAVVLVVLVVILFLQTWRASIIPLVAVPVSVVGTFAWLYLLGYSINTLTLFEPCSRSGSSSTMRSWSSRTSSATSRRAWRATPRTRRCARCRGRSSRSRSCCARCSCRWRSCPASRASSTGSSR